MAGVGEPMAAKGPESCATEEDFERHSQQRREQIDRLKRGRRAGTRRLNQGGHLQTCMLATVATAPACLCTYSSAASEAPLTLPSSTSAPMVPRQPLGSPLHYCGR